MDEETMNIQERYQYLRRMKELYWAADRQTKHELLDNMHYVTGYSRNYLCSLLQGPGPYHRARTRERGYTYGPQVMEALALMADVLDWPCAERLKPVLPSMAQHLAQFDELEVTEGLLDQLARISVSTVRRRLADARPASRRLPLRPGRRHVDTAAQRQVPIALIPWDVTEPGHFEADLVLHNRSGLEGQFVCTLQCVDVLTGWSERIAILGYEFGVMWQAFHHFRQHCPIPVREIHVDNGPEFLNAALLSHFAERAPIPLTRGRPGQKNDNRFVEQRNSSGVRAYLDHLYLFTAEHARLLNELYEDMWLYHNFFQPVLRQIERKAVLRPNGICRIVRKQDQAKTPLQRLLQAKPPLSRQTADDLCRLYDRTNLRVLNQRIHQRLDHLYQLAAEDERRLTGSTTIIIC